MPGAALACVAALPARYVATGVLLGSLHLPTTALTGPLGAYVRWQLGAGLAVLQAAALATLGLAGAVCWSGGTLVGAGLGYLRLLRAEAGHLVAALALASLAAGIVAAVAYAIVLALPPQTWVLAAADSYSHYATLPIGLLTLAALVELGERAASTVKRAGVDVDADPPPPEAPPSTPPTRDVSNRGLPACGSGRSLPSDVRRQRRIAATVAETALSEDGGRLEAERCRRSAT